MDIMAKAADFVMDGAAPRQEEVRSSYLHSETGIDAFQKKSENIIDWMDSVLQGLEGGFEDIKDTLEVEEKDGKREVNFSFCFDDS